MLVSDIALYKYIYIYIYIYIYVVKPTKFKLWLLQFTNFIFYNL